MCEVCNEKESKENMMRHSMAHVMAKAIRNLYPNTKFAIGPAIDNGFYYDIDLDQNIGEAEFEAISKEMNKIIAEDQVFTRKVVSRDEALKLFSDQPYKLELIRDLPDDETITVYYLGDDWYDLCRGPHVPSTKYLRGFAYQFNRVSGAYWRGSEKNKMLQRIYVYGFTDKAGLKECLRLVEEAKERDHRKIGKDLGIFMLSDLVGKGLPMWLPNGFTLRRIISDYIMNKEISLGYLHVMTPSIGNVDLYKTSGHWDHYKDDMFPAMQLENEAFVLRPMNCPHHMVMYKNSLHSYRDLPIRIAEVANDFRFEDSGTLIGIERARCFTQNDSHIFCRPDQIESEVQGIIDLMLSTYKDFHWEKYRFRLSLRDPNNKEKYFGNDHLWEISENALRQILKNRGVKYYEAIGEAAFYGPKIDVQVESALGHDITLSTLQLDYQLPEKFELEYIDENSEKQRPVVIHRAIFGSLDRTVAFLLEETKGALPVWLSPVQVRLMGITENNNSYIQSICEKLRAHGYRVDADMSNEKIGKKIRSAQLSKIPYMLVVGDKEEEAGLVAVRHRSEGDKGTMTLDEFIKLIDTAIAEKI